MARGGADVTLHDFFHSTRDAEALAAEGDYRDGGAHHEPVTLTLATAAETYDTGRIYIDSTTTPYQLAGFDPERKKLTLSNQTGQAILVGKPSAVRAGNGFFVASGANMSLESKWEVWVILATSGSGNVYYYVEREVVEGE